MLSWISWSVAFVALVVYLRRIYSRFSKYNVKHLTPFPLLGNTIWLLLRIEHFVEYLSRTYESFPGERFVGSFQFTTPSVLLRDPELIKRITTNDFQYFLGHDVIIDKDNDPLAARTLFALRGDDWKDMRPTLSPTFTIYKIRLMVPSMVEVGEQMLNALKSKIRSSSDECHLPDYVDIDVKEMLNRYAHDVFALCACGIKMNSHIDEQNPFYLNGKNAAEFRFRHLLIFFGLKTFPKLINRLKISYLTENNRSFFRNLIISIMKDRKERNVVKPDMINVLMKAKKAWSDDDLVAQVLGFIVGASGTVPNIMIFVLYELAVNMDVQDKLLQEIRENHDNCGGKIDYNSIQQMKYLDMVVSEVLRLWPVTVQLGRHCNKDYNLGRPNDKATKDYIIKAGEGVVIPVWAMHRDPNHFPDPERFDPERFSEQNKHNIKPYTYMPFGLGPRNCIGYKYALCVLKVMIYQVLLCMEVSPAAKTQVPAQLDISHFALTMKGGHWIRYILHGTLWPKETITEDLTSSNSETKLNWNPDNGGDPLKFPNMVSISATERNLHLELQTLY